VLLACSNCIDPSFETELGETVKNYCLSASVASRWVDGGEGENDQEACNLAAMIVEKGITDRMASEFKEIVGTKQDFNLSLLALSVSSENGQPYIHSCWAGHKCMSMPMCVCVCARAC
jgi:hypothetical protein